MGICSDVLWQRIRRIKRERLSVLLGYRKFLEKSLSFSGYARNFGKAGRKAYIGWNDPCGKERTNMERSKEFQEFCNQMLKAVKKRFPEKVTIEIHKVLKNNSTELDGLVILAPEQMLSPNFYLQMYFEEYKKGVDIASLAKQIEETYYEVLCDGENLELDMSFESCEEKIVFRLVSYDRNSLLLQTVPHLRFLDMAVTFHILLRQDEEGIGSVRITNQLSHTWNLDAEALFNLAKVNTKRIFPQKAYSMTSMMKRILDFEKNGESRNYFNIEAAGQIAQADEPYVITNSNGINGASVILYTDILKEIGEFLGEDFYLLPSSIHEMLAIPVSAPMDVAEMHEMVGEVNKSCVVSEEILSDNVYRYECRTETIRICTDK
jgi:hypothetical protein